MDIKFKAQKNEGDFKVIVAVPDVTGKLVGYHLFHSAKDIEHSDQKKVGICSSVLAWDVEQNPIQGIDIAGFHTGWQDFFIHYNLQSVRNLNWLENTLFVMGELCDASGNPISVSPYQVLKNQITKLGEAGYTAYVATELEFYLVRKQESETLVAEKRHDYRVDHYTNSFSPFFDQLCMSLEKTGIKVESWQSEWGVGQWEVNLSPGSPLQVAESHLLFKLAVTDVASQYGYKANFMAKPFSNQVGSSCHTHISLKDNQNNKIFFDETQKFNMSQEALCAVQGLLSHARDLLPLYASNINSYKRLVAKDFSGHAETWGLDNRTTTCRMIGEDADSLHIEFRLPGADANPYLVLAGVLASVRSGLEEKITPNEPISNDATTDTSLQDFPLSLRNAINGFSESTFVKNEFKDDFVDFYRTHLEHEQFEFDKVVTEWELNRYGD